MVYRSNSNKTFIATYFIVWIFVALTHGFILYKGYNYAVPEAITDAFVFNFLFSVMALNLRFAIKFSTIGKELYEIFLTHFLILTIFSSIWFGLSYGILHLISFNDIYYNLLSESIPIRLVSGVLYYFVISMMFYLMSNFEELKEQEVLREKSVSLARESELKVLRSQINPHFIFNALNSVNSLLYADKDKASKMLVLLSDFMRYALNTKTEKFIPLSKEIENIERYLNIEKIRFGSRLVYQKEIDANIEQIKVPVLILQPVFENAIKHGVGNNTEKVNIRLKVQSNSGMHLLSINNNIDENTEIKHGTGTGLTNIKERLFLLYNRNDLLQITKNQQFFKVDIYIPK